MVLIGVEGCAATSQSEPTLDSQHAIMSAAMTNARRARMRVEADRQLLANRLARLQSEEVKAMRRIEETHRRTQEILSVKTQHQQIEYERQASRAEHDEEMMRHRQQLAQMKEERRYAVVAARQATVIENQSIARSTKMVQSENALQIARSRGVEYNLAATKRNAVRRDADAARDRKRREKELLINHLNERAEGRRRDEEARAEQYNAELAELQRKEAELLASLQEQRDEHRHVFEYIDAQLSKKPQYSSSAPPTSREPA